MKCHASQVLFLLLLLTISCQPKSDKEEIENTIAHFLKWYSSNNKEVNNHINEMIDNSTFDSIDYTRPYTINFEKSEAYLTYFKEAGFVSDQYLNAYQKYFEKCQADFTKEPQYEGPANGFDYDFIFRSQDYSTELEHPEEARVTDISIDNDHAIATVQFNETSVYTYTLSKKNNQWYIDWIKAKWED